MKRIPLILLKKNTDIRSIFSDNPPIGVTLFSQARLKMSLICTGSSVKEK